MDLAPAPELPPVPTNSDFASVCSQALAPNSYLYDEATQGDMLCVCYEDRRVVECSHRSTHGGPGCDRFPVPGVQFNCCCWDWEYWNFDADGKFVAVDMCQECKGTDCGTRPRDREQCLRLHYTGSEITGCEFGRVPDQCEPENLPVCGTCALCEDDSGLPGIIHTCYAYENRVSGPRLDSGECESFERVVLYNQGHQFP